MIRQKLLEVMLLEPASTEAQRLGIGFKPSENFKEIKENKQYF